MKNIYKISLGLLLVVPFVTFSAGKDLASLATLFAKYLNIALELIIALAVLVFIWNVFRYFFTDKDKAEAGMYVLYSIIGFFVILSFWGLVNIVKNTIELDNSAPTLPALNFGGSNTTGGTRNNGTQINAGSGSGSVPINSGTGANMVPINGGTGTGSININGGTN